MVSTMNNDDTGFKKVPL